MSPSQSTQSARLILDQPAAGAWNMAVDEALLASAAESDVTTLRFYRWNAPTLSLGYFQPYAARTEHTASRNCPVVRRSTGGGAIVHDAELTYSLAIPGRSRLASNAAMAYEAVHNALIGALSRLGVSGRLWSQISPGDPVSENPLPGDIVEPFLCFLRRTVGDVVVNDVKIAGSAQRRHRGAILQHGSVILRQSDASPELAGVSNLTDTDISIDTLTQAWLPFLDEALDVDFLPSGLTADERCHATQVMDTKYTCADWIERR